MTDNPEPQPEPQPDSLLQNLDEPEYKPLEIKEGEKPEGLAEDFWDAEKKTIKVDDLHRKYLEAETRAKGLRDKLAKGEQKPPKDIKEYIVEASDKGKAILKDDDPLVEGGRKIAQELGMSKEMFAKFMGKMTDIVAENFEKFGQPKDPDPVDIKARQEVEFAKIGGNGKAVAKAVLSWANGLMQSGQLSETEFKTFQGFAQTGEDIRVLNKLRVLATGKADIPMDAQTDGLPSDAEIAKMFVTPEYKSGDPAYHAKVATLLAQRLEAGRPEKLQF